MSSRWLRLVLVLVFFTGNEKNTIRAAFGGPVMCSNYKLMQYLLNNTESPYDPNVRPSIDRQKTTVMIIPNQFTLLSMDQAEETVEFFEEFMMSWVDPYLTWDRNQSGFQDEWIKIPEAAIWVPDVIFDGAISITELLPRDTRMVDVRFDGTIRQSNPSTIVTPCHLDIQAFPYDKQECRVSVGPWMFDATEVVMTSKYYNMEPDDDTYKGNSEWDLDNIRAEIYSTMDFDRNFSAIYYYIKLTRRPVYYVLVIQAPTFIIGTMTLFGIFTPFSADGRRRERVTLGLTMLLSISMMFTIVADMMPKASRLPLLGNYILLEIFLCAAAVLVSVVILVIHHRTHTRAYSPPRWISRMCTRKRHSGGTTESSIVRTDGIVLETDSSDLMQLLVLRSAIGKTMAALSEFIGRLEREAIDRMVWLRVFDVLDLICLVIFQIVNVVSAIVYMKGPTMWPNILPVIPHTNATTSSTHVNTSLF